MTTKEEKIKDLEQKLKRYEGQLTEKSKGFGQTVRTRFGDPYEEQLSSDTNLLKAMIQSTKTEIANLKK